MASSADRGAAPRDLLDDVDDRLPAWRVHRPARTLAAGWPTRTARIGGRDVELFSLPAVGVTWFDRRRAYWWRRVSRAVLLVVAALVQVAVDVGIAIAAGGARTVVVVVLVVLAAAALLLFLRPDLLASRRTGLASPLPVWARGVLAALGVVGAVVTPVFVLGTAADLLPRFPVQERVAWDFVVGQLDAPRVRAD